MQRHAASAVVAGLLVAIGCSSSAATNGTTGPARACPATSLHTTFAGVHKCLDLAQRKRIHAGLARARDRGLTGAAAYRATARAFRVGVNAVRVIGAEGARSFWALPPAPRLPAGVPILPADGPRAASGLASRADCLDAEPGRAVVRLAWRPAAERGSAQRVIVTIFLDGFERSAFDASGDLPSGRASFEWFRPRGQANHLWRVLTRHGEGWVPSATGRFAGPTCPVDSAP